MSLAIFDLDNTLISDDSDHLWGQFLVEKKLVDSELYDSVNTQFYHDYCQGNLLLSPPLIDLSQNPSLNYLASQIC